MTNLFLMPLIISVRNRFTFLNILLVFFLVSFLPVTEIYAQNEVKNDSSKSNKSLPGFQAEVIKVVDGDTLKIRRSNSHKQETVRLIGLDAPEVSSREQAGQEPYGTMAQQYLSVAITRKIVRIEQDVQTQNEAGEILGYVWVDDKLMNEEMLKAGLSVLVTVPPNVKYVERLQKAQSFARTEKKVIWSDTTPLAQSPSEFRSSKRESASKQNEKESELEIPDYVAGCIIGNRKTRKFHVPEGRYYNQAKESKNRVFFKNAADAEKAGYTKSAR